MEICQSESPAIYSDPDAARAHLEALRWQDGVICPHCGLIGGAWRIRSRASAKGREPRGGLWKCAGCRLQFTVTVGNILENTKIPVHKWLLGVSLICMARQGVSCRDLQKELEISYKTAQAMARRIRYAQTLDPLRSSWAESARQRANLAVEGQFEPLERGRIQEILALTRKRATGPWISAVEGLPRHGNSALSLWPLTPDRAMAALLLVKSHSVLDF